MSTISSGLGSILQTLFTKADANDDGQLDATELGSVENDLQQVTGTKENANQLIKQWDTDANGTLSTDEFTNGGQLASAVQQALLQAQEFTSGGAFAAMLDGDDSSANSTFGLLGGNGSGGSNSLASMLGGDSSSSGNDTITSMLEQIIARYQQQSANVGTAKSDDDTTTPPTQPTDTTA